jgi:tetratricopeptide (TPR) repeat protein
VAQAVGERLLGASPAQRRLLLANHPRACRVEVVTFLLDESAAARQDQASRARAAAAAALEVAEALPRTRSHRRLVADLRGEAWLRLGNARRIAGDLAGGDEAFARAEEELRRGSGDADLAAELLNLKGSLRRAQRRLREAKELLRQAARAYALLGDPHLQGKVLLALGTAWRDGGDPANALRYAYQGACRLDPDRDPYLPLVALHNLAHYYEDLGWPGHALELLEVAEPLYEAVAGELTLLRMHWQKGRLMAAVGGLELAALVLDEVRLAFADRELPYDAALAALDLAAVWARLGEPQRVRELAAEMLPVFTSKEIAREARLALLLFVKAAGAEKVSAEAIAGLARRVEQARPPASGSDALPAP